MGAGFENVVLKIVLMQQHQAALVAELGEVAEPIPVPGIELREVVLATGRPRPCQFAVARAGERLFVERRGDVAIHLPAHRVVVAAPVVPQTVVMVVGDLTARGHVVGDLREIIGEARAHAAGHESRDRLAKLRHVVRPHVAAPPQRIEPAAGDHLAVGDEPAVLDARSACGLRTRRLMGQLVDCSCPQSEPCRFRMLLHPLADHVNQFARRLARLRDKLRRFFERRIRRRDRLAEDRIDALCAASRRRARGVGPDTSSAAGRSRCGASNVPSPAKMAQQPIAQLFAVGGRKQAIVAARHCQSTQLAADQPVPGGVGPAIDEVQRIAVDPHVVVEHAGGPAFERPAVGERLARAAIHKGVRARCTMADGKIMPPMLRPAAQKQRQLALVKNVCRRKPPISETGASEMQSSTVTHFVDFPQRDRPAGKAGGTRRGGPRHFARFRS